jgi:hypothetical protein
MNAEVAVSEVAKTEAATEVEVAKRMSSVKRGHIVRAKGNR